MQLDGYDFFDMLLFTLFHDYIDLDDASELKTRIIKHSDLEFCRERASELAAEIAAEVELLKTSDENTKG